MSASFFGALGRAFGHAVREHLERRSASKRALTNEEIIEANTKELSNRQLNQRNRINKSRVSSTERTRRALEKSICDSKRNNSKTPNLVEISSRHNVGNLSLVRKSKGIAIAPPDDLDTGLRYYHLKCPSCDKKCMHVTTIKKLVFDGDTYRDELGDYEPTPFDSGLTETNMDDMVLDVKFYSDEYTCESCESQNKMEWGACYSDFSNSNGWLDTGEPCSGTIHDDQTVILREKFSDISQGYCTQCNKNPHIK